MADKECFTLSRLKVFFILCLMFAATAAAGQDNAPQPTPETAPPQPAGQVVEAAAADGLTLVGEYFTPPIDGDRPALLLLHQLYTTRKSWAGVVPPFLDAGYRVLAVDLRGYGETRGRINWGKAIGDVQTWMNWLHSQPGVRADAVSIIGSSMGSNLALVGCANDAQCLTAIAISPALNYYGVRTDDALKEGLSSRSALIIASKRDKYTALSLPTMIEIATGELGVQTYEGNTHGMDLFLTQTDLIPLMLDWLNRHLPQ